MPRSSPRSRSAWKSCKSSIIHHPPHHPHPSSTISRGYIVSPFGQDGFAILPAPLVLESLRGIVGDEGVPGDLEPDV
ncbi:hypothetical protein EON63_16125 [archaeon]|nr:MAG: hypothetical protein EON63_16125 [archaeon]